jgi:UDP-N-acetylmuramoyl-tripeptide--D-alanyl-D-alanine ligase
MAMRGVGQIAELTAIAAPDVGVIVNVGPVHLELLGTIDAVAAAKAELIMGLRAGSIAVVPAGERLLAPHLRADLKTITFGEGGDVRFLGAEVERARIEGERARIEPDRVRIHLAGREITLEVSFRQAHLRRNLLAAIAAASAVGVVAEGRVELALTPGRGERAGLAGGVTVIDDCYNANPMSMHAALEDLAATAAGEAHSRTVAVLGDMLELGPGEGEFHAEIGAQAARAGVDLLVTVGPRAAAISERFAAARRTAGDVPRSPGNADAAEVRSVADAAEAAALLPGLVRAGDVVLVKGSRGVGLELVCRALRDRDGAVT